MKGAEVMKIEAAEVAPDFGPNGPSMAGYLRALGLACMEAAGDPKVRPLLLALLLIAPRTICELRRVDRIAG